jgi:type 1 glutamine amidotransferase
VLAFITAEGEYRSNQRLPELAHDLLLTRNVNCEFAIGKPVTKGEGRHNIENLQILNDADLAVFFIRRRALESEKMDLIREYIASGNPVMGIRTTSHAFDAKGKVPREGRGLVDAKGKVSEFLAQWPEFDEEVLGGNYDGHYGHLKEGTNVTIVPGMENHPVLKGISREGFNSPNWLYKNRPLRSPNLQVLLLGTITGQPAEPVLWINNLKNGKVIYTSLGHWDDWEIESFRQVILNSIDFLLHF